MADFQMVGGENFLDCQKQINFHAPKQSKNHNNIRQKL